jgi:hypothetical protein
LERLQCDEYAVYEKEESITRLVKLTDLIIWALQRSIPYNDCYPFELLLKEACYLLTDIYETEGQININFRQSIGCIISAL